MNTNSPAATAISEKGADDDPVGRWHTALVGLPPLISVERAAALLGLSRASAYRYAKSGDLPVKRLGGNARRAGRVYVITARLRDFFEPDPRRENA